MSLPKRPKAAERGAYFIKLSFQALHEAGGSLKYREVKNYIREHAEFVPSDTEIYQATGYVRWESILSFYSISCVKAGFIVKRSGRWHLTPEGEALRELSVKDILSTITSAYREWRSANPREDEPVVSPELVIQTAVTDEAEKTFVWESAEGEARAEIEAYVLEFGPYKFQDLVAALLRAMGYSTPFVAPTGPDGGTDVLAYPDPLGAKTPHIRVQVKHRPSQKATREEIAALRGIIRQDREIGLFVSTAGFTSEATREARNGSAHIELMDLEKFLDSWLNYYERLSEDDKSHLRLRPIYFLAPH